MVKRRYETASEFLEALVATPEGSEVSDVSVPVENVNPNSALKPRTLAP